MSRARGKVETPEYAAFADRMIHAWGRRVGNEADPEDLAEMLAALANFERVAQDAIDAGLARGWSWADVARAAGVSKSAAWQRWRKAKPQPVEPSPQIVVEPVCSGRDYSRPRSACTLPPQHDGDHDFRYDARE